MINHLHPPASFPANTSQFQEALRRRREELTAAGWSAAETQSAKPKPKENKRMPTYRTKLDPQEYAHVEALIRRGASDEELADWRKQHQIHHKSFTTALRDIRRRVEAPPSPMAAQIAALESAPARTPDQAPAVIVQAPAPARPAQIDPVIHWLTTLRAMRDELAQHGVTVAGSLRIEIEL